jgi:diadenosine tetraphosphate (Ap4A) HIT family hydrolase
MYNHYRNKRKNYTEKATADQKIFCSFCEGITPDQFIRETEHSTLIKNRLPYDLWEHHKVLEHLLVVPKRHVHTLGELSSEELLDLMSICSEQETKGFSVYARASDSPRRSVHHQHTHLIKIDSRVANGGVYLKKPYLHVTF